MSARAAAGQPFVAAHFDHRFPAADPRVADPGAILLVESDPEVGQTLADQLAADGYRVVVALSAAHARALTSICPPLLAVLGRFDSPRGALDLLADIRRGTPWREDLPVIVLGSSADDLDLLRAFEAGADDFLARPPRYLELRARLRARLRRAGTSPRGSQRHVGSLHMDTLARTVELDGRPVSLCRREYELLLHLARDPTRVCSRTELLRAVWGQQKLCSTRTLDSQASRLRRKLAEADADPPRRWVISVRGVGYRLI